METKYCYWNVDNRSASLIILSLWFVDLFSLISFISFHTKHIEGGDMKYEVNVVFVWGEG